MYRNSIEITKLEDAQAEQNFDRVLYLLDLASRVIPDQIIELALES
jgi:hypothetical protein